MAIADMKFEVVPKKLRDELATARRNRAPSEMIIELEKGETVWVAEPDGDKLAGLYTSADRRGFKNTVSKVTRSIDGKEVIGHLAWWTRKEEVKAGA